LQKIKDDMALAVPMPDHVRERLRAIRRM
jgi:hypothetical protein